jgi:hypothetical protein
MIIAAVFLLGNNLDNVQTRFRSRTHDKMTPKHKPSLKGVITDTTVSTLSIKRIQSRWNCCRLVHDYSLISTHSQQCCHNVNDPMQ